MWNRRDLRLILSINALLVAAAQSPAFAGDLNVTHPIPAAQSHTESAILVDVDGLPEATLRGDEAGVHTQDSARDKACTSISLKIDTQVLETQAPGTVAPGGPFPKSPYLLLFGGEVVIRSDPEIIDAIGAAVAPGDRIDDGCARAELDKIKDRLVR